MRRRLAGWIRCVLLWACVAHAGEANAQMPVCQQPTAAAPYYTACLPMGRVRVARLLGDFAIDHVMKAEGEVVQRRVGDLLRALVSKDVLKRNLALREYVDALEPLVFARIDTATGTLDFAIDEARRSFAGDIDTGASPVHVSWDLPARLSGGYWRTPDVLQVAFWQGKRARMRLAAPGGELAAEIECLVVSADGVRIVTSGADTPDILIRFDECD